MRGICLTTHVPDDSPATAASLANFVYGHPKAVAGWHATADDWSAIRPHDYAVMRPARGCKVEGTRAHVCFQLCRTSRMRIAERFRVDGTASNKNGQATSGPAMLIQRGVHIDHQALPQGLVPPVWRSWRSGRHARISEEPSMM
jgi:hypothetical protein